MEYMALKKPIVQFDLKEGRASALNASLYAENNNIPDFAAKIVHLLDNPQEAQDMGEFGYNRVLNELSWQHEQKNLINFYKKVFA
jgi:glycosyltransferase involved in cell wall biosynthesis